jgi:3-isopropylmalate dehydrogenase
VAVAAAAAALVAAGAPRVRWLPLPMGLTAIEAHGDALPAHTLEALGSVDGWLMGPHDSAAYPSPHRARLNPSGQLRKRFDLYANVRPARALPGVRAITPDLDVVVVRENTQGFYADRSTHAGTGEYMPSADVAVAMAIVTRPAVERIARTAFALASQRRGHVSIIHKANVLPMTMGMFRDVCYEVAAEHPAVEVDDFHIDAVTVHLLRRPSDFDVIVTENMFGDILSNLTGELAGSVGMAPSVNASSTVAMAQAAHGSAPDIAGRGIANPVGMMLSTAMLLGWLGDRRDEPTLRAAADLLDRAVVDAVGGAVVTGDLGGSASTVEFTEAVLARITRG